MNDADLTTAKLAALEARLEAHRKLLGWLLVEVVADAAACDRLLEVLNQTYPPQDHQEDPGAVPTEAFGSIAAFAAEIRASLAPLKEKRASLGQPV